MAKSRYWDRQFAKFDGNKGQFVPTWSWWALIFNVFWYAWKGMWPKLFIFLLILAVVGPMTGEESPVRALLVLFWILYPPMFGKWDYYLVKKRGTYFW